MGRWVKRALVVWAVPFAVKKFKERQSRQSPGTTGSTGSTRS